MTRTRRAGVIVAAICGLALMGCGTEDPSADARDAAAQSSKQADEKTATESSPERSDGANRGRRSNEGDSQSPSDRADDPAGESAGTDRSEDTKKSNGSEESTESSAGGSDDSESTPNDEPADAGGDNGSGSGDSTDTPTPEESEESEESESGDTGESTPDDSHPGPAWTPDTLVTEDLVPRSGYGVANDEDTLDRPSIADPCRSENLASEQQRQDRKLLWWSPNGKQGASPIIAVDGVSYPAGGAAAAVQEIRERVSSCTEQSYGKDSTLKLSMADTEGLVADSVVVEMELSGNYSGTGRAIYQHIDNMVVVTFAMYELEHSEEANDLVTGLAQDYADRILAGR